jgi:hypothetical protein
MPWGNIGLADFDARGDRVHTSLGRSHRIARAMPLSSAQQKFHLLGETPRGSRLASVLVGTTIAAAAAAASMTRVAWPRSLSRSPPCRPGMRAGCPGSLPRNAGTRTGVAASALAHVTRWESARGSWRRPGSFPLRLSRSRRVATGCFSVPILWAYGCAVRPRRFPAIFVGRFLRPRRRPRRPLSASPVHTASRALPPPLAFAL